MARIGNAKKILRGLDANRPVLEEGELALSTDNKKVSLGVINGGAQGEIEILTSLSPSGDTDTKQVKTSATDTTEGYLYDKISAGAGITVSRLYGGANEQVEISAVATGGGGASTNALVSGEAISAADVLALSESGSSDTDELVLTGADAGAVISFGRTTGYNEKVKESFTLSSSITISKVELSLCNNNSSLKGDIIVGIYNDNAGSVSTLVSGAQITIPQSSITAVYPTVEKVVGGFPSDVVLPAGNYHMVVSTSSPNIINFYYIDATNTDVYAGGFSQQYINGAWLSFRADIYMRFIKTIVSLGGDAIKSDSATNNEVVGIAKTTVVSGASLEYYGQGEIASGFTGLTKGTKYYLSSTAGQLTTTPNAYPVGTAISTTEILVRYVT